MTEYFDIRCVDDLDPMARDVGPLEALRQDLYHWSKTARGSLIMAPNWGGDLTIYLSKPLPTSFADDVRSGLLADFAGRIDDAQVTVTPTGGSVAGPTYQVELIAQVDATFLTVALAMSPDGIELVTS